ncbi:MAG: hypothetical protein ABJE95_02080 [Byssovorax sp.]
MRARSLLVVFASNLAALPACGGPPPAPPAAPVVEATAAPTASPSAPRAPAPAKSAEPVVEAPPAPPKAPPEPVLPPVEVVPAIVAGGPTALPSLTIAAPTKNQVIPSARAGAFAVKLKLTGWDLSPTGNRLCVRIDRHPCHAVTDLKAPLTLKDIDPTLDDGQHVITVLARRASGELVKPSGKSSAFASLSFFVGKKVPPVWKDGGPMIFFDAPADGPAPGDGVLLDFYVANAEVAAGKYQIQASVGGPGLGPGAAMILDSQAPLRIKNPRPGEYLVRLALLGRKASLGESSSSTTVSLGSAPVGGPFSEVTRSFRVIAPSPPR